MKFHFKEGWELTLCCVMTMFIRGFQIIWNGGYLVGENNTKYVNYSLLEKLKIIPLILLSKKLEKWNRNQLIEQ